MKQTTKRACARIEPMLWVYADGELNTCRAAMVKRHLRSCSSCASLLQDAYRQRELIEQARLSLALPADIHESVMTLVRQSAPKTARRSVVPVRRGVSMLAAAACFLLVFGGVWMAVRSGGFVAKDAMVSEKLEIEAPLLGGDVLADAVPDGVDPVFPMPPTASDPQEPTEKAEATVAAVVLLASDETNVWQGEGVRLWLSMETAQAELTEGGVTRTARPEAVDGDILLHFEDGKKMRLTKGERDGELLLMLNEG